MSPPLPLECLQVVLAAAAPGAPAEASLPSLLLLPGLVVLAGMAMLVRELRSSLPREAPAPPSAAAPTPAPEEVPLAVIAAAVAATLEQPHRIVSVSLSPRQLAWSIEGRRQGLTSHPQRRQ